jgi:hypothetical protein
VLGGGCEVQVCKLSIDNIKMSYYYITYYIIFVLTYILSIKILILSINNLQTCTLQPPTGTLQVLDNLILLYNCTLL